MVYNGTMQFTDVAGKKSTMRFYGVEDITKLETLANGMSNRSCSKVNSITISQINDQPTGMGSPIAGKWDSVDDKAEIIVEDTATGRASKFLLPAPLDSMFDHVANVGYVMKKAQGDAFVGDLNTATGRTYRFLKGRKIGLKNQPQV